MLTESWQLRRWVCCLALVLLAQAGAASADLMLFRESVDVSSQSQQERQRAASKALARVLVRVSGTRNVLQSDAVRGALGRADRYLSQYSYRRPEAEGQSTLELVMDFEPQATTDILRRANEPVWSARRPVILAWIELGEGGGRQVVSSLATAPSESMASWARVVEEESARRGLPVVLPSRSQVLAYGGVGNLAEIARQQGAQLVLGGDLRLADGRCDAEWNMALDGEGRRWHVTQPAAQQCVASAMDAVAEAMSARYAFAADSGGSEPVMLQVDGVGSFEQYADVLLMLQELAVVDRIGVDRVGGGRVRFGVVLKGDVEQLQAALRMQRWFVESDPQPDIVVMPPLQPEPVVGAADTPASGTPGTPGTPGADDPGAVPAVVAPPPRAPLVLYYRLQGSAPRVSATAAGAGSA